MAATDPRPWRAAWSAALYGDDGFSLRGDRGPRHDFSTSVTRGPALAAALARLVRFEGGYDVVDVGAGDGSLLTDLRAALDPEVASRGRFLAVELAPRPTRLAEAIEWLPTPPEKVDGLLIAHELLDTVPCEIVEVDPAGVLRVVGLDTDGRELLGDPVGDTDAAWLDRWWPITRPGQRADVGRSRDAAWQGLTDRLTHGVALAIDYGHTLPNRPAGSTLAGWARGRPVPALADGSCDITAHVAFDSCRTDGDLLLTQRDALCAIGREPLPAGGPRRQLAALADAANWRALLDPGGLGGFHWLVHATPGVDLGALRPRDTGA